ncbi:MAG: phosphate/phosphite/phosphonate ABC transporter substrate-binding protein [Chloroflexota bacterium]
MSRNDMLILGAVAYAPKVVTIWEGFKEFFIKHDLPFDYILYSNYETQVEHLLSGSIDVAWNSPLAWIRADRLAKAQGKQVKAIAMRDTDCNLTSVIIVRSESPIKKVADLKGKTVAVGAIDSPQASLIPLEFLRSQGLIPHTDFTILRHDVLAGKHGDHVGGERDAAQALMSGKADAACVINGNYAAFEAEGLILTGSTRVLAETPAFDHCNFTVGPDVSSTLVERFHSLLMGMSYDDPEVRPLMELEGLKEWRDGRVEGYHILDEAVNDERFYDANGVIVEPTYQY